MRSPEKQPMGYKYRSSQTVIIGTACLALLTEVLLYGFVVPILPYMLEVRLHYPPSQTQHLTTSLLGIHGFATVVSAPILAHFLDKTSSRRSPLLLSLTVALVGTLLVAFTPAYWVLILGRVLQGIAGAAAWIICLAVLVEYAGQGNMGKMMGASMSIVVTGTVGGPVIAGALLELAGYWPAWCLPLGFLAFDIIAWLILIEKQDLHPADASAQNETSEYDETVPDRNDRESSPLLVPITQTDSKDGEAEQTPSASNFYFIMLPDIRVIVGISNSVTTSIIVAALNTTLPVHLRQIFGWGPLDVGTMFLLLRVPGIILGPISGWLRDHVGLRYPTTIGWMVMAPMLIVLGIPGNGISWASGEGQGKPIFIFCVVGMGLALPFIQGSGMLHVMTILEEYESKQRNIFGPRGGRSRVFAMNEVAFNLGLMLGPLFAGPLSEMIGFDRMSMILGCICFVVGLASFRFFRTRNEAKDGGASV